jgi:hypothetical protein
MWLTLRVGSRSIEGLFVVSKLLFAGRLSFFFRNNYCYLAHVDNAARVIEKLG